VCSCARGRGRGSYSDRGGVVIFMLILLRSNPFFKNIFPKISSAHSTSKSPYWARELVRDRGRGRGRGRARARARGRGRARARARGRGRGGGGGGGRGRGRVVIFMLILPTSITFFFIKMYFSKMSSAHSTSENHPHSYSERLTIHLPEHNFPIFNLARLEYTFLSNSYTNRSLFGPSYYMLHSALPHAFILIVIIQYSSLSSSSSS
jgi:hypothetical protein